MIAEAPAAPTKKADLGVRAVSGIIMIAIAVFAFWLGGPVLALLIFAISVGVLWEAWGLVRRMTQVPVARALWMAGLFVYAGVAAFGILMAPRGLCWIAVAAVIATDIGAYFAGRAIGGPKIAPSISPSKTWAGLFGGMTGAALVMMLALTTLLYAMSGMDGTPSFAKIDWKAGVVAAAVGAGALVAIVAQAGDFFESWLKRRAGVKDSGTLIPGHGGLFDRLDGILSVSCLLGLVGLAGLL